MEISAVADATEDLIKSLSIVIEIAHFTLVIYGVRCDWDPKKARQQPVATWLMSVACCFGGGMLISIAIGKPALTPLSNNQSVVLMTIVWWQVFYSPLDATFLLLSWKPMLVIIATLKEMIRTRKIMKGVRLSQAVFPNSLLICTIIGLLGGCGGGFIKYSASFVRKKWDHESVKNIYFSPISKLSLLFSLLYNLQIRGDIDVRLNTIVLLQFVVLSIFSAGSKLGVSIDPFRPFEKLFTCLAIDYSMFESGSVEPVERKDERKTPSEEKVEKETKKKRKSTKTD